MDAIGANSKSDVDTVIDDQQATVGLRQSAYVTGKFKKLTQRQILLAKLDQFCPCYKRMAHDVDCAASLGKGLRRHQIEACLLESLNTLIVIVHTFLQFWPIHSESGGYCSTRHSPSGSRPLAGSHTPQFSVWVLFSRWISSRKRAASS